MFYSDIKKPYSSLEVKKTPSEWTAGFWIPQENVYIGGDPVL